MSFNSTVSFNYTLTIINNNCSYRDLSDYYFYASQLIQSELPYPTLPVVVKQLLISQSFLIFFKAAWSYGAGTSIITISMLPSLLSV
jgi:hypothetical protein